MILPGCGGRPDDTDRSLRPQASGAQERVVRGVCSHRAGLGGVAGMESGRTGAEVERSGSGCRPDQPCQLWVAVKGEDVCEKRRKVAASPGFLGFLQGRPPGGAIPPQSRRAEGVARDGSVGRKAGSPTRASARPSHGPTPCPEAPRGQAAPEEKPGAQARGNCPVPAARGPPGVVGRQGRRPAVGAPEAESQVRVLLCGSWASSGSESRTGARTLNHPDLVLA